MLLYHLNHSSSIVTLPIPNSMAISIVTDGTYGILTNEVCRYRTTVGTTYYTDMPTIYDASFHHRGNCCLQGEGQYHKGRSNNITHTSAYMHILNIISADVAKDTMDTILTKPSGTTIVY